MGPPAKGIAILPLGAITPEVLERIRRSLARAFCAAATVSPGRGLPATARLEARDQYDSAHLIPYLESHVPADADKLLGICDVDLCTPILTFVFGAGVVGGRVAVLSLHRLRPEAYGLAPNEGLFLDRCATGAVHEIGHTCGLRHCFRYDCVMHPSESVEQTDLKREFFCPSCAKKLADAGWC